MSSQQNLDLRQIRSESRIQSVALNRVRNSGATTVPKKHIPATLPNTNFGLQYIKPAPQDMSAIQARRRARAGGAVVPSKTRNSPHSSMTPIFSGTFNKPPVTRTSHHSFLA
jgi:hypothetical protein